MTNPHIVILPKGIKDMGDVFNSRTFKNFIKKESSRPKEKPLLSFIPQTHTMIVGGKGRSYLDDYLKTLSKITLKKLATSKRALGRTVAILNIEELVKVQ